MAWWVCWDVSDSGGDVLDPERPCWLFFFFFFSFLILSVLVLEVEGERRKGKERERNSKTIIKNNI